MKYFFLLLCFCSISSYGESLFAINTNRELVVINTTNPSQTTKIGTLDLASDIGVNSMAYHPGLDRLFAIGTRSSSSEYFLIGINRNTAQTSTVSLGLASSVGYFETLDYVDSLNSLVISNNTNYSTTKLYRIAQDGSKILQATTTLDNDYGVYDSNLNKFYTTDPNGAAQFVLVNLSTGASTNLGAIPTSMGDLAFRKSDGVFFGMDYSTSAFYKVTTTNGANPITVTSLGIATGITSNLAFAPDPIPEPNMVFLMLLGLGLFYRRFQKK